MNSRKAFALVLALLVAAPTAGIALPVFAAPTAPAAPGPLPNGTLPNGTLPNGTFPNGSLPNGTFPNGTLPNGSFPNGTLPNGSLPGGLAVPEFFEVTETAGIARAGYSRVAWGDYDSDGFDDLMFNGGVLYRNNRDGTFSDTSFVSGTRGAYSGGVWGDYNNDGRLDYYATAWQPTWDTLFRNNGDGTFTNVTAAAGMVMDNLPSEAAAWADYDLDGCLDLYVANYEWPPLEGDGDTSFGTPNILWHNKCDGTFENATVAAGVFENRRSRGVTWGDYNNDGRPDLFVSNYRLDPNELWVNLGNGIFENRAMQAGVDCDNVSVLPNPTGACGHSIGADFGDFNNDGNLDLYVANLAHPQFLALGHDTSQLYRNRGAPTYTFVDERETSGIRYCETASNPLFADFNADGMLDIFVTSVYENMTNNLYLADRPGHYEERAAQAGLTSENGWGAAASDYDNDGDMDLVVGSSTGVHLFRNGGNPSLADSLQVRLIGRDSNKGAVGARVSYGAGGFGGGERIQEVQAGEGTGSQSSARLFFGLGDVQTGLDISLRIEWPSGLIQNVTLEAPGIYTVEEPEGVIDVAITSLLATPNTPIANAQVTFTATIENVGTAPADDGSVEFWRTDTFPRSLLASRSFGNFSGPLNLTASMTAPASGSFVVEAMLTNVTPEDQEGQNDQQSLTLTVRGANTAPVANLTADAVLIEAGGTIRFDGSRSTDDSGIMQYIFDFGDQASSLQTTPTADHQYNNTGSFTARLTVIDDNGLQSTNDEALAISVRTPGALPPQAFIDAVTPESPEMLHAKVIFDGHGESVDATIIAYEWSSNIDSILSTDSTFETVSLSLGQHTISLKVQDSNGVWSDPATTAFRVAATGTVQVVFHNIVDGFNIRGVTTINGTATPPSAVTVTRAQWRVDNGSLETATGTSAWTFVVDPSQYTLGPHDLTVIVTDSQGLVTTRTHHVVFAEAGGVGGGFNLLYIGAGAAIVGALAIAFMMMSRGKRRKAPAATPANLRKLPVVPPPPAIRPLPVRSIQGPPRAGPPPPGRAPGQGPPKQRVRVKAAPSRPASPTPGGPHPPPPANP